MIENYPKLLPNNSTGGWGGINYLRPDRTYIADAGFSLTAKVWLNITGSNDPLYYGSASGQIIWGYDAIINRLDQYGANTTRLNIEVYNGATLVSKGYIDVHKEWLELMKATLI